MTQAFVRALRSLAVLFVVMAITFFVFYEGSVDPALAMCGRPCDPDDLEAARVFMGFDSPWYAQFALFFAAIFVGRSYGSDDVVIECAAPCFGYSFQAREPVTELIIDRFPVSFSVAIGAAVLWTIAGVVAGLIAARRRDGVVDRAVTGLSVVAASAPAYVVGLLAIVLFAFTLDLLPSGGYEAFTEDPLEWALHLVLPWVVLAFLHGAVYSRLIRSSLIDQLSQDYIRTARGAGLSERTVNAYALRNVAVPVSTLLAIDIGALLAGTVITERVFGLPGLGQLLMDAVASTDLPVLVGTTLVGAVFVVIANLGADLLAPLIDPRLSPTRSTLRKRATTAPSTSRETEATP